MAQTKIWVVVAVRAGIVDNMRAFTDDYDAVELEKAWKKQMNEETDSVCMEEVKLE